MKHAPSFSNWKRLFRCVAMIGVMTIGATVCRAQAANTSPNAAISEELNKYPGLMDEFGKLFQRVMTEVKYPDGRKQSSLLPVLPESTMTYVAVSNYGDPARQILKIFREELRESEPLRKWWGSGEVATAGPKVEAFLEKFSEFEEYVGNEAVFAGTMEAKEPKFFVVAETRKPGLKTFLEQWAKELGDKGKPAARVMDAQGLASVKENGPSNDPFVLVESNYVVMGDEAKEIRKFAEKLEKKNGEFPTVPFGQRVAKAYDGGTTVLAAVDLQKIIAKSNSSGNASADKNLQATGFGDVKYAVWQHTGTGSAEMSKGELSFTGPRHAVASWLGKPKSLDSLDFVSPNASIVITIGLKDPTKIYDEAKEMAEASKSNSLAFVPTIEQAFKFSLRDDLLAQLGGEITAEVEILPPAPLKWRAILKVNDATHLLKTLTGLLEATHTATTKGESGGVTTYSFLAPVGMGVLVSYAIVDGYLIVGPSREAVAESAAMHRSGASLAKSKKFLASLPPGRTREASGMFYEDPVAMASMQIGRFPGGVADILANGAKGTAAQTFWFYDDESAIREESVSAGLDVGGMLVAAAIAIPNVLRSKIAANEASAVGSLRTVVTAQVTYASMYPARGFAANLTTLGPNPDGSTADTAQHANLIDASLAAARCIESEWCVKSGYWFRMTASCKQRKCSEFVVKAVPETTSSGTRSFCATSDGVIRYRVEEPTMEMVSGPACKGWEALQ